MFTGIVTDIGKVLAIRNNGDFEFTIGCSYQLEGIPIGGSIAHDGVCLTVTEKGREEEQTWYKVNVSHETVNCTKLKNSKSRWDIGSLVNLERSLKVGDELGGHIVTGHVDGVAIVNRIEHIGESIKVSLSIPYDLAKFITRKGSVALNGTSLTVNTTRDNEFAVNLIPHTRVKTTWNSITLEDHVNVEIDPLARYVARLNELRE